MSDCTILGPKRDYFSGPPGCNSSTPLQSSIAVGGGAAGGSPLLLAHHDLIRRSPSPLDESCGYYDEPTSISSHENGFSMAQTPPPPTETPTNNNNNKQQTSPLGAAMAVYEQPMAKAVHQLHLQTVSGRQTNPTMLTTFKVPPATTAAPPKSHKRHSSTRNSLESLQSRLSSPSVTHELHEPGNNINNNNNHYKQLQANQQRPSANSLVKIRHVSPPEVPPGIEERVGNQEDTWRSIPLNDDPNERDRHPHLKKLSCPAERGLSSIMLARLRGKGGGGNHHKQEPQFKFDQDGQRGQHGTSSWPGSSSLHDNLRLSVDATNGQHLANKSVGMASDGKPNGKRSLSNGTSTRTSRSMSAVSGDSVKQQIGKRKAPFMFAGILGSILGSVFFSLGILTIKLLPDGHGLAEKTKIACSRGIIMMLLCSGTILKSRGSFLVPREEILINVLRSVFGFMGIYMSYMSLKYISMGDATALVFSSPVWTSLLSHYILHEPLQWIQLLALPLSLLGILLIAHPSLLVNMEQTAGPLEKQPILDPADVLNEQSMPTATAYDNSSSSLATLGGIGDNINNQSNFRSAVLADLNQDLDIAMNTTEHFDLEHRWKGIVIALACSFVVSLVYIVLKFRKSTPIQTATFWLAFTTVAGSLFMGLFVGLGEFPTKLSELALLLLNGVCSWLGQSLLQWALAYEDASVLSVVRTLDVAMSFTLSAIFLNEQILWTSILGAAIIALVVVSIMLSNYLQSRLCPPLRADMEEYPSPGSLGPHYSISSDGSNVEDFNTSRQASMQSKDQMFGHSNKSHGHHHQPERTPQAPLANPTSIATAGA